MPVRDFIRIPRLWFASNNKMTHKERTKDNYRSKALSVVTVTDITELSDTVKGFELSVAEGSEKSCNFVPGQWVDVHIPEDETVVGGYSITSSPNQFAHSGKLGLAIQYSDHPPTHWMHTKCSVGTRIRVRVGGDFFYDPAPSALSDLLLVAGGIGINPIYSIMKHQCYLSSQVQSHRNIRNVLLYSAKNCNELIFREDINELVSLKNSEFKCRYFSTRDKPSGSLSTINNRRVTEADIQDAVKDIDTSHFQCYICGPPPLINFVSDTLLKLGIQESSVHYEKWW